MMGTRPHALLETDFAEEPGQSRQLIISKISDY